MKRIITIFLMCWIGQIAAAQTATVPVEVTIRPPAAECEIGTTTTLNFGGLTVPAASVEGTARIDPLAATVGTALTYESNQSPPAPLLATGTPSWGTLSVTALNSATLTVTPTFPPGLSDSDPVTDDLSFTGLWSNSATADGTYTSLSTSYSAAGITATSVSRFFRFGGTLTITSDAPTVRHTANISVVSTCAS